ncbi:uncharacterized protein LOC121368044 [Gigantopelta aegis]|uniref:uncharacterized protein LOC121368044 n=1 Tax=Gigantopelta aegis TaxID=1735272 RepID=UPI001B88895D|nr:uncharacterized protein LOC121368044 [Gigantopelta aegis]
MKFVLFLFAVATVTLAQDPAVVTSTPDVTTVKAGGVCRKDGDCGEGYCCVSHAMGFKRRFIFLDGSSSFFGHHDTGRCEPERKENESCYVFMVHDIFNPNLEEGYCPCMAGLECRGETVEEIGGSIIHHNPKCQPKQASP